MNKPSKPMSKPTTPVNNNKSRRIRVATLLNAAATLGALILIGGTSGPKLPPSSGD